MKLLFIFGTRPEAVKMAPLIKEFNQHDEFKVKVCVTGQHRQMLDQVLNFFKITPDYDLNVMSPNQTLYEITTKVLLGLKNIIDTVKPDLIFVQGDTTTAFVGALAGYYSGVKVAHVEAGLRSSNLNSPFPEEGNRRLVGQLAYFHFAPTQLAMDNLHKENILDNSFQVGNTVVDALLWGLELVKAQDQGIFRQSFSGIDFSKKIVLITGHRRESFGKPFMEICTAIKDLAVKYPMIQFIYPVHLNPNVREPVGKVLHGINNVLLIEPLSYPHLIWILNQSYFVLTDSGGIQEEAPSLGKPVLVFRDVTERTEGIDAGTALLVGTSHKNILKGACKLIEDELIYKKMSKAVNPYGDGTTSKLIVSIIMKNKKRIES